MTSHNSARLQNYDVNDEAEVEALPTAQTNPMMDSSFFRPSVLASFNKPDVSNSNRVNELPSSIPSSTDVSVPPATTNLSENAIGNSVLSPKDIFHHPAGPSIVKQTAPSDYVFGANISSRVTNTEVASGASSNLWSIAASSGESDSTGKSVNTASVFTTLAKAVNQSKTSETVPTSLVDSAAIRLEQANKQASVNLKYVKVVTGEEDETLVFRSHCRAHVFDSAKQQWNAIGAAEFHLNDLPAALDTSSYRSGSRRSRVVVRLAATGRVIVNSPVWKDMSMALVDARSLRIAAVHETDDQADGACKSIIKNFLFIFPADASIDRLFSQLTDRKEEAADVNSASSPPPPTVVGQKRSLYESADVLVSKVARSEGVEVNATKDCSSEQVSLKESTCAATEVMVSQVKAPLINANSPKSAALVEGQLTATTNGSEGDNALSSDDSVNSESVNSSTISQS